MRFTQNLFVVGLVALISVTLFAKSSYSQQTSTNPVVSLSVFGKEGAAEDLASPGDTVVKADSDVSIPVTTVGWRSRGWYGSGGYVYQPYSYGYTYYPKGCWWNGHRWVCPKRVKVKVY